MACAADAERAALSDTKEITPSAPPQPLPGSVAPGQPLSLWVRPESVSDDEVVEVEIEGSKSVSALLQRAVQEFGAVFGVGSGQLQALNGDGHPVSNRARIGDTFAYDATVVVRAKQQSPPAQQQSPPPQQQQPPPQQQTPPPQQAPAVREGCCTVDGHGDQQVKWFCESCLLPVCTQCRLDGHPRAVLQPSTGKRNHADHEGALVPLSGAASGELRVAAAARAAAHDRTRRQLAAADAATRASAAAAAAATVGAAEDAARRYDAAVAALTQQRDAVVASLRAAQQAREQRSTEAVEHSGTVQRRFADITDVLRRLLVDPAQADLSLLTAVADIVAAPPLRFPPVRFPRFAEPQLHGGALDATKVMRVGGDGDLPETVVACNTEHVGVLATTCAVLAGAAAALIAMPPGRLFSHQSDFDTNGVFHWIGTKGGSAGWLNPHTQGWVKVSMSSKGGGNESQLVAHTNCGCVHTNNSPNQSFSIDLKNYELVLVCYTLRNRNNTDDCHPCNWDMEGSTDGAQWTLLDSRRSERKLMPPGAKDRTATFTIDNGHTEAYRHFRLTQKGKNDRGDDFFVLGGLELYGTLTGDGI